MNFSWTTSEMRAPSALSARAQAALGRAITLDGKLSEEVLAITGMSGRKYRYFINNLIESLDSPKYLEVGVWAGSTLCSAIYGNRVTATAIDNWSEYGGPSERFFSNLARFKGPEAKVSFLERDFRQADFRSLGVNDIYLFDGPHSEADHFDGLALAQPALADEFVLIIDDWNWATVRNGTFRAIRELNIRINFVAEIRTTLDGSHPQNAGEASDWHNGYFIAACSKVAV